MRLRKRAGGLLIGAAVLFLIGTMVQAGWLYVIAAMLLGAARRRDSCCRSPRSAGSTPRSRRRRTHRRAARRRSSSGWRTAAAASAGACGCTTSTSSRPTCSFPSVRPHERIDVTTRRTPARRGEVTTGSITLRSAAPFGVAERVRRVPVQARTLVLPRVLPLPGLPFVEPVGTLEPAIHTAPRRGHGPDYLAVRDYRPGDPMRHVHWGLTAAPRRGHGPRVRGGADAPARRRGRHRARPRRVLDPLGSVLLRRGLRRRRGVRERARRPAGRRAPGSHGRRSGAGRRAGAAGVACPAAAERRAAPRRCSTGSGRRSSAASRPSWWPSRRGATATGPRWSPPPCAERRWSSASCSCRCSWTSSSTLAEEVHPGVEIRPWRVDEDLAACLGARAVAR